MYEENQVFRIKRTPLSASRLLTINSNYIEFEGPLANTNFTKEDIEGFRSGVTGFRFYMIPFSRTYNIEIKGSQGKILSIRMHSFFGLGNRRIKYKFIQIYKQIQKAYFNEMAIHYVRLLNAGLTYELAGTFLTDEGILLRKEKTPVPWIRIGLASYYQSCSIYDISDPQHFRSFDYWHDWNAALLRSVIDYKIRSTRSLEFNT
jgi:hypothetical protein